MNSKDKLIISKLIKVAEKQQNALTKLSQVAQGDPATVKYLQGAWQTAALNSGVTAVSTPTVTYQGSQPAAGNVTMGESYTVSGEIPVQNRELMQRNFDNQIKAQKPDLTVSTIFKDPVGVAKAASKDSKSVIQKLISIAEKQQKIISKLAQFAHTGLPGDPLDPGDLDAPTPAAKPPAPPAPPKPPAPKPKAAPAAPAGLPMDLKSALDRNFSNLKGSLLVAVDGKDLNISFNADRVKDRPSDLKEKMNKALEGAGYTVSAIVGHMNPAWKANY
jgi:hypothetical protein